jgi:hypothetical protein
VERQHGSSKKAWSQSRGQERRRNTQAEQGGPQRLGPQRRAHACKKKGGAQERTQASLAGLESKPKRKPAVIAGFFLYRE